LTDEGLLNYEEIEKLVFQHKPTLLIIGASAYPREINFKKIREILDRYHAKNTKHKCIYMVDIAHIAGLVVGGQHMSPFPYADVVTTTTHKTLRGTRGAVIMCNDEDYIKQINRSVFPGCQGGPLEHAIAGKAVAFGEALKPEFKQYIKQVVLNCKAMAKRLLELGYKLVSGGTDNHLLLVDLTPKGITGKDADKLLQDVNITTNKNTIPNDPLGPKITSGLRLGTAAITTRGFKEKDAIKVAELIDKTLINKDKSNYAKIKAEVKKEIKALTTKYPIY
jgi:glycine hydroxymethyltransferase